MKRILLLLPVLGIIAACAGSPPASTPTVVCQGIAAMDLPVVVKVLGNAVSLNGTTRAAKEVMTPSQMSVFWKDASQLRFLSALATGNMLTAMNTEAVVLTQASNSPNGTVTYAQAALAGSAYKVIAGECS